MRFGGRPAAWESILPARRPCAVPDDHPLAASHINPRPSSPPPTPSPSTPPSPPPLARCRVTPSACARSGGGGRGRGTGMRGVASAVRVAHSSFFFQCTVGVDIHPVFTTDAARKCCGIHCGGGGGKAEYGRFIVWAAFIKMELNRAGARV